MSRLSRPVSLVAGSPLNVVDGRTALLVPYSHVRQGGTVVATKIGLTRKHAHRRAILFVAQMLEKDLTARYEH